MPDLLNPSHDGATVTAIPASFDPVATPGARHVRRVYVGAGGAVVVKLASGAVVTFANIPSGGQIEGWFIAGILAGTTATGLVVGF